MPVRSAVVFLKPSRSLPPSPFAMTCDGAVRLSYAFDTVALWTLSPAIVLDTPYYDLWPLAGIMGDVTTESVLDVARRINAAQAPKSERRDLENVLMLLTGLRISRATAKKIGAMIPMIKDIWEESTWKDALADLATESLVRKLAMKALISRFGALDPEMLAEVDKADTTTCDDIISNIGTDTLEQVNERLHKDKERES